MFLGPTSLHRHTCVVLPDLAFLPFYFNLTFPVFFHSSVLMHPEHYTDLDNLDTVENNLRHSAKGSNDAYDVSISLTRRERQRSSLGRGIERGEPGDVQPGKKRRTRLLSRRDEQRRNPHSWQLSRSERSLWYATTRLVYTTSQLLHSAPSNGQPFLFDCHRDRGKSSPGGQGVSPCETWLRQPRRRVSWSSTTGSHASSRSRGNEATPPRQEARCMDTPLPEATEMEIEEKRRVREGVQEEGDETTRIQSFRSRRERREVFARVCGQVAHAEKGRKWRSRTVTHECVRHGAKSSSDGFCFLRLQGPPTGRRALQMWLDRQTTTLACLCPQ